MSDPVKRRPYDNTTRVMTSQARRASVLAAARTLFLERGYVRTTMSAIAENASRKSRGLLPASPAQRTN